jgi:hypothetical protein
MISRSMVFGFALALLVASGCARNEQTANSGTPARIRRPESSVVEPAQATQPPDHSRARRGAIMGSDRILEPITEQEKNVGKQDGEKQDGEAAGSGDAAGQDQPADGDQPTEGSESGSTESADAPSGDPPADESPDTGSQPVEGQPATPPVTFVVAEGTLQLVAPPGWVQVEPAVNMIEAEFAIPGETENDVNGRTTVMGAGGSVEANIDRWIGQFSQPDGTDSADKATIEQSEIQGCPVHCVDIAGTYLDGMGGPNAPQIERPGFRMLAAIIETPDQGSYFIKFYGPEKLVAAHADGFKAMLKDLKIVE